MPKYAQTAGNIIFVILSISFIGWVVFTPSIHIHTQVRVLSSSDKISSKAPKLSNKQLLEQYASNLCQHWNGEPDKVVNVKFSPDDENPNDIQNFDCVTLSDHTVWDVPNGQNHEVHL